MQRMYGIQVTFYEVKSISFSISKFGRTGFPRIFVNLIEGMKIFVLYNYVGWILNK